MISEDNSYALALVRAHILDNPEYRTWVPPYITVRWARLVSQAVQVQVGGHYRLKAPFKQTVQAINCTCKLEKLELKKKLVAPVVVGRAMRRARSIR